MNKLNNWTIWIHLHDDENWDISSYKKIGNINTKKL